MVLSPHFDADDIEIVEDWEKVRDEGETQCYVRHMRGFMGKMHLKSEQPLPMTIFAESWKPDIFTYMIMIAGPVMLLQAIYECKNVRTKMLEQQ